MNDPQFFINWGFAVCGALMGWIMKFIYDKLKDLQAADLALVAKVQSIEILVAGEYVKRDALERMEAALFAKLDRIEDKLDGKVDK
jgi:hypothetical protein